MYQGGSCEQDRKACADCSPWGRGRPNSHSKEVTSRWEGLYDEKLVMKIRGKVIPGRMKHKHKVSEVRMSLECLKKKNKACKWIKYNCM